MMQGAGKEPENKFMRELEQYKKALQALPNGCIAAEAEAEKEQRLSVEVTGGKTGCMSSSEQTELFVRASGTRTGLVYTQKLDADPGKVIVQALENSKESASKTPEPMEKPESTKNSENSENSEFFENSEPSEEPKLISIAGLKQIACRLAQDLQDGLNRQAKEEDISASAEAAGQAGTSRSASAAEHTDTSRSASAAVGQQTGTSRSVGVAVEQVIRTTGIVNSYGLDRTSVNSRFTATAAVSGGYGGCISALRAEDLSAEVFVRQVRLRQVTEQPLIPSEAGEFRAVLSSEAVNSILITAWQMFSARRAQSGSTPFAGKEGQMIFSPCITIRDYKGGAGTKNSVQCGFSWGIDCEGVRSRDLTLVENGVLKGWMHNLSTAKAAGVCSTGNAGRKTLLSGNIHTDMAITPKNFTMESGAATLEELFEACGDGVYVFENYDEFHALNVVSGDFAFPCKALRIRGKKPVGLMEGLTMSGNVAELFSCVELLGNNRVIEPFTMYESYTISGPAMLVGKLRISG